MGDAENIKEITYSKPIKIAIMIFLKICSFIALFITAILFSAVVSFGIVVLIVFMLVKYFFEWLYYAVFPEMKEYKHVLRLSDFDERECYN